MGWSVLISCRSRLVTLNILLVCTRLFLPCLSKLVSHFDRLMHLLVLVVFSLATFFAFVHTTIIKLSFDNDKPSLSMTSSST